MTKFQYWIKGVQNSAASVIDQREASVHGTLKLT